MGEGVGVGVGDSPADLGPRYMNIHVVVRVLCLARDERRDDHDRNTSAQSVAMVHVDVDVVSTAMDSREKSSNSS
jgi:hypothetical protein